MAVAGATSWRGVSRTLGLASKGGRQLNVLKKRVEALRLDTDHFTGTRRWSPAQLRQSAERSTWAEATDSLGVSDTRQNRTTIKRQAALAGITTDHLDTVTSEPAPQPVAGLRHLREAATSIAAAWFTLRGFTPSLPLEAKPYDLLVDMGNSIQRVQVKSCMAGEGMVTIAYRLSGTSKGALVPYSREAVDQFFVLDGELAIYLIPIALVEGRLRISLRRYRSHRVGSAKSLLS